MVRTSQPDVAEAHERFDLADELLTEAEKALVAGIAGAAIHAAYYASFHAAKGLLALEGVRVKTHAGVLADLARLYVKTGRMPRATWMLLERGLAARTDADYGIARRPTPDEAGILVSDARRFVAGARELLPARGP